jgi:hypothetical protein
MSGWADLLGEALAQLPTTEVVTRAKEERTNREHSSRSSEELRSNDPSASVVGLSATVKPANLDGDLASFHKAVDKLDRDTCRGDRCQGSYHCRRHTRRQRA